MKKTVCCLAILLCAAARAAPSDIVARAGDLTMTQAEVTTMLDGLDAQMRARVLAAPDGVAQLVRARLTTEALLAEANARNWAGTPDVARQIAQSRDNIIVQTYLASVSKPDPAYPSDQLVQTTYEANKAQFVVPRQYHLSQLVLAAANATARQAADLRRRAASSDRAFAAAGKQPGVTETDLGWIAENRLAPDIRAAVAGLSVGGLSDPIRLSDGFHVFRLVATRPAATAPLAEVKPQIVAALRQKQANDKARAYIAALQGRQHVEINEIALAASVPK